MKFPEKSNHIVPFPLSHLQSSHFIFVTCFCSLIPGSQCDHLFALMKSTLVLVLLVLLPVKTALVQSFLRKSNLIPRSGPLHAGSGEHIPPPLKTLRAGAILRYKPTSSKWITSTNLVQAVTFGASAAGKLDSTMFNVLTAQF